jgi:hypothetical protein
MQSWWSRTYNRPLKDPLLQTYTLEELLYEFYDKIERAQAEEDRAKNEEIKDEETKEKDVLDWVAEEERKEAEARLRANSTPESGPQDPTKNPDNVRWMEDQIRQAKSRLGDDFGSDLELNFDE